MAMPRAQSQIPETIGELVGQLLLASSGYTCGARLAVGGAAVFLTLLAGDAQDPAAGDFAAGLIHAASRQPR